MARAVIGEASAELHPLIMGSKCAEKISISSHEVSFVEPKVKPKTYKDTHMKIRIMPKGCFAGIFLNLNKASVEAFKRHVDKASRYKTELPTEKSETTILITPQVKAAATKKKNAEAKKKTTTKTTIKKATAKKTPAKKAVKKAVKKKAVKRPATRRVAR